MTRATQTNSNGPRSTAPGVGMADVTKRDRKHRRTSKVEAVRGIECPSPVPAALARRGIDRVVCLPAAAVDVSSAGQALFSLFRSALMARYATATANKETTHA